jgi:hypothetical protein
MHKDNIRQLMRHLPAGYEEASRETGAMRRRGRSIGSPSDLMWLVLTHLSQGQTLANMSALSEASGLGRLSDVAFMKRLINCGGWFEWILGRLGPASVAGYLKPRGLDRYRVLAVDASVVRSGVSKFSRSWRLHFALDVFSLASHEFRVTDDGTGETLANFRAAPGDLFLADRGYASKRGMAHCLSSGADFILRLRHDAFAMRSEGGERLDLLGLLAKAETGEAVCIPASVDLGGYGLGVRRVRVCALKKSKGDMEKTMKWMSHNDNKKQRRVSQGARRFSEYVVLVTSLPDEVGPEDVLAAYRYRWQVELYFKRLKSLLEAGEAPKKRAECMKAWLNGKMVLAVLFEVLLSKLDFSPPRQG